MKNTAQVAEVIVDADALPSAGVEMEGGFFVGVVMVDGARFGFVVSPKDLGETKGAWGERGKYIDAAHFSDGLRNTMAMAEADSPIAKHVRQLDINGHQDWYIPSRDELELIYRNLKPGAGSNYCSFRDGENPSSVPHGHLYTEESPAQTTMKIFQAGGEEAMEQAWYWSSTQYSAYDAFGQYFADGNQGYDTKNNEGRVRAVRRFNY